MRGGCCEGMLGIVADRRSGSEKRLWWLLHFASAVGPLTKQDTSEYLYHGSKVVCIRAYHKCELRSWLIVGMLVFVLMIVVCARILESSRLLGAEVAQSTSVAAALGRDNQHFCVFAMVLQRLGDPMP